MGSLYRPTYRGTDGVGQRAAAGHGRKVVALSSARP
jgi:hypothetical protein